MSTNGNSLLVSSISQFDVKNEKFANYFQRLAFFCRVNMVKDDFKADLFLATVGPKTFALSKDLLAPKALTDCSFNGIGTALKAHYETCVNIIYEQFKFYSYVQKSDESIMDYIYNLKALSSTCEFKTSLEEMLRDKFVVGL